MAMKEVKIYGGGMSGMVAAINLAREGHKVVILEAEEGYGGSRIYNPSTHVTAINIPKTSDYIGIDIQPVFHQVRECPAYFHDTKVQVPVYEVYGVERGDRPGSLDTLLHEQCQGLGVEFHFSSPLTKDDVSQLEPGTIIACGLIPEAYEIVGVPYMPWHGWISRGEVDFTDYAWLWYDESITEYGYISSVNNYYFNLLMSFGKHVREDALDRYEKFMMRNEHLKHDNWEYVGGAVPMIRPDAHRLFHRGLIMCGTMTGAMDPFMGFGISGALVTGKIAAVAVSNPRKAREEFDRFLFRFRRIYYFKEIWKRYVQPHITLLERLINLVGPQRVTKFLSGFGLEKPRHHLPIAIPGFGHMNTYRNKGKVSLPR